MLVAAVLLTLGVSRLHARREQLAPAPEQTILRSCASI